MICPHCKKRIKAKKLPTEVQLQILKHIHGFTRRHGYAPTYRGLADELWRSPTTIFEHMGNLRSLGLVGDGQIVLTEAGRAHAERVLDK